MTFVACSEAQQNDSISSTDSIESGLNSKPEQIQPKQVESLFDQVFSKDGNIYVSKTGIAKQVTFNSRDFYPVLVKKENRVYFFRGFQMSRERKVGLFRTERDEFYKYSLMSVELEKLEEKLVTDKKSFQSQDPEGGIYTIDQPTLDPDGEHIYFTTGKYATGNELVKVSLKTGQWTELFPANSFERILSVNYLGYYLVGQSVIGENGRGIYYRLVDTNGEVVKKFDSHSSMEAFKKSQNIVCQNQINK